MKMLGEMFWVDRWTGSSAFLLPLEARGLYREMLSQAWRRGAQLPNDPDAVKRAVGAADAEWERTWPLVRPYWHVEGDVIYNPTQRRLYAEAQAQMERAGARAKKANLVRWGKDHA